MAAEHIVAREKLGKLRRAVLWYLGAFVVSRGLLHIVGLRFFDGHVAAIMHFPELDLLRDRLGETLWYLHGQPPLPSVTLGLLLKCFGEGYSLALEMIFHALSAATGLALIVVLSRAGWRPGNALVLALGFVHLPAILVYEHYAFTTLPVLAALLIACVPLQQALQRSLARDWFWFFLALAVVVNLRNVFHLAFWILNLLLALRAAPAPRRRIILAALVPFLLASSFYFKNLYVYGRFEASSWIGFGLARKSYHQLPLAERKRLITEGVFEPITSVPVFGTVDEFSVVLGTPPTTGIPLLDRQIKATGHPNYHHAIYIEASREMRDEALRLIRLYPEPYIQNVRSTLIQLFQPSRLWGPVATPAAQLGAYATTIDDVLHGELKWSGVNPWSLAAGLFVLVGALGSLRVLVRGHRCRMETRLVAFLTLTILYLYAVAVLLDTNETMRHRLKVDGVLVLGIALLPTFVLRRREPMIAENSPGVRV